MIHIVLLGLPLAVRLAWCLDRNRLDERDMANLRLLPMSVPQRNGPLTPSPRIILLTSIKLSNGFPSNSSLHCLATLASRNFINTMYLLNRLVITIR
jgi:hypothetical protein